ncbi:ABC transporter substrate-binding protein [Deinococcus yavapaiensis]|uniref:Amino acid/amide ABC transporter substrate-binding protein (HAAT family) n=1 Tax=Deinococcus yavapaiensis KR-236 TaxID=694435 RepID=A0A318SB52_9DEIO|nr:ABC transporter substrate-binding protein [Deinococcus yavapaiensis]PYE53509.1 amino acid/amide ABC transporter substrate-binding protein (HAAT family) [Deinococcus yavapaiensis KR-236]
MKRTKSLVLSALLAATVGVVYAQSQSRAPIRVGVIVSTTGPAASLGIPQRNTVQLLPQRIGNTPVEYIVLDDASDTTTAVQNTRKLIQENKVDLIIGPTTTPASLAMIDVVADAKVPNISLAASAAIIDPVDAKRFWVFKTPQTDAIMANAIVQSMAQNKIRTVGYIGFNDAYGEGWYNELRKYAAQRNIRIVANERYNRTDTSVTGQVLRIVAARPDAVLIGASGVPGVVPQAALKARNFTGRIYQTHGVANADFLRVGGRDVEGAILPAGPILVAEQLPDSNPNKKVALNYIKSYEDKFGAGTRSTFGAHLFDAGLMLQRAAPIALRRAQPGTAEFRSALRDAIEGTRNLIATHGTFSMRNNNHLGLDSRSRVMVTIENGTWKLLK